MARISLRRAVIGLAFVAATLSVPTTPAHADNGDGVVACNIGEICFWRYDTGVLWTKQFWDTGNHGGYNWWCGCTTTVRMQDDAVNVTNRDTECRVRVGDRSPNTGLWTWRSIPNDHLRKNLLEIRNRNDRHERCA